MANQGLFTTGPSVEDLLQQRNTRALDLQRKLMQGAAQGARDPAKAQAVSFLGSSLGRALAGAMGGEDKEMEAARTRETTEAGLVKEYATAASGNDVSAMYRSANNMLQTGDPKAIQMGSSLLQRADQLKAQQATSEATRSSDAQEALDRSLAEERNYNLSVSIREANPALADQVEQGSPKAIELALKIVSPENADKVAKQGAYRMPNGDIISGFVKGSARFIYGPDNEPMPMPTSAVWVGEAGDLTQSQQKLVTFKEEQTKINGLIALGPENGGVSAQEGAEMLDNTKSALGMQTDPNVSNTAKQDALNISNYLTESTTAKAGSAQRLASLQQSIAMLDAGMYTGTGAGALQAVRKLAIATGVATVDTEIKAANVEQFRANVMDAILDRIALTKGAISQKEMEAFAKASIGLDRTVAGNKLLLETSMLSEQWVSNRSDFISAKYAAARKEGKLLKRFEMQKAVKEWEESNKLVLPTAEQIAAAKSGGNISTAGSIIPQGATNADIIKMAVDL